MDFYIPKTLNYHIEDGWQSATLASISYDPDSRAAKCSCLKQARFTFYVDSDPRRIEQDAAARTFCCGEHGEELLDFLKNWLGSEFQSFIKANGALELDKLIGRRAEIYILHKASAKGKKHDHPFCKIAVIRPVSKEEEHEAA